MVKRLNKLWRSFASRLGRASVPARPARQSRRLELETLEDRLVPTILFTPNNQLTYTDNKGPVISHPHVELVFWGNAWNSTTTSPSVADVQKAASSILTGPYLTGLGQYRTLNVTYQGLHLHLPGIGTGSVVGTKISKDAVPANKTFNGTTVGKWLAQKIDNKAVPTPESDPNILYMVMLPKGLTLDDSGNNGLHTFGTDAKGTKFHFAYIGNDGTMDFISNTFSHELAESVSDPEGTAVQVDPRNATNWNEISDNEAQSYSYRLNGYQVQSYWSARDKAFIVPTGQQQNFTVTNGILTVQGDQLTNKNDTITIDQDVFRTFHVPFNIYSGVRVTMNGETVDFPEGAIKQINVVTGAGTNVVNVLHTGPNTPVTINGIGTTTVNLGSGGITQTIRSDVTIGTAARVSPGQIAINVDDSADPTKRNVNVQASTGFAGLSFTTITGLTQGQISYFTRSVTGVTVKGGTGGDTDNVLSSTAPLTLINQGYSPVLVGRAGSVQGITGNLTVKHIADAMAGSSYIYVGDYADTISRDVTYDTFSSGGTTFGRITGLAPGVIAYQTNLHDATMALGTAGGTAKIASTSGSDLVVDTNGPTEIDVGNAGLMAGIKANLTVVVNAGAADLVLDDTADPTAQSIDISSDGAAETVAGLTTGSIRFFASDTSNLAVRSGTGDNAFTVEGTLPGAVYLLGNTGDDTFAVQANTGGVAILGGGGHDKVLIGKDGNAQGILGPVFIANDNGGTTTVTVDDSADPDTRNATLGLEFLTGLTPGAIRYGSAAGTTALVINGNDTTTFDVQDTADGVNTTINAGANALVSVYGTTGPLDIEGAGQVNIGNVGTLDGITGQITLGATTLVGKVVIDDSNDATGRDVTVSNVEFDGLAPAPILDDIVANLSVLAGVGDDTFHIVATPVFTQYMLDGGDGVNTLDYSALAASVVADLQTGTATGFAGGISRIQNVIGSSGGGAGSYNVLVGNGGNVLTGGNGQRNLLIAGSSASTLLGGDDEDILIAGVTSYDQDIAALTTIATEWARTDEDYATRVANLESGNGGVPVLSPNTVFSNEGGNTLTGNAGLDFFFSRFRTDHITDYTEGEIARAI